MNQNKKATQINYQLFTFLKNEQSTTQKKNETIDCKTIVFGKDRFQFKSEKKFPTIKSSDGMKTQTFDNNIPGQIFYNSDSEH